MHFCNNCSNMYYISLKQEDSNDLIYYCRNCGHNDNKLIIHVDMCPIEKYKTKWIITIKNNYMNKILSKYLLKFITNLILTQDNNQFKKQCKNDLLRSKYLLQNKLKYEKHIEDIHNKFKTYKYPELDDFLSYCERLKIR